MLRPCILSSCAHYPPLKTHPPMNNLLCSLYDKNFTFDSQQEVEERETAPQEPETGQTTEKDNDVMEEEL